MGPEALEGGALLDALWGSEATSPAWGSAQVNEPPRGPGGSKSSRAEEVGDCSQCLPGNALHPGDPRWLRGSDCRGQPPASPINLPSWWGTLPRPLAENMTPCEERLPWWGSGVARAAQPQDTFPTVLDPSQPWFHNLCSQESASWDLWEFQEDCVFLLPSPSL